MRMIETSGVLQSGPGWKSTVFLASRNGSTYRCSFWITTTLGTDSFLDALASLKPHIGQFPQDGENGCFMSIFFKSRAIMWPKIRLNIFSSIVPWSLCLVHPKTLYSGLWNFFGVPLSTPTFALLSHFWVKIRAPLLPNLQSSVGFELLIISGVKFWWFSFLITISSPFRSRLLACGNWPI